MELLARGSESYIYLKNNLVLKDRIRREYMEEILDQSLRKTRTSTEYNILAKLHGHIPVPKVYNKYVYSFEMEFIDGVHPTLDEDTAKYIGKTLRTLHDVGIIHYDLSVYNLIDDGNTIYVIDFGLSFRSNKIEDKAMDILVGISQAIDYEEQILEAYGVDQRLMDRIKLIRSRARYASI